MHIVVKKVVDYARNEVREEGQKLALSAGRALIATSALWCIERLVTKALKRNAIGSKPLGDRLKEKTIETLTERAVNAIVGKDAAQPSESDTISPKQMSIVDSLRLQRKSYHPRYFYQSVKETAMSFPLVHGPMMRVMFYRFWQEVCDIERVNLWFSDKQLPPKLVSIDVGSDEPFKVWQECTVYGSFEGQPVVMDLELWPQAGGNIVIMTKESFWSDKLLKCFRQFIRNENYLKRRIVDANGYLMDVTRCPTWDDLRLSPELKQKIRLHTTLFLEKMEILKKKGLRATRGNLWQGIPGVGKTMTATIVARDCYDKATFLASNGGQIHEIDDIKAIFEMARWLAPTVLLIDDIDRLKSGQRNALLFELDGMHNNEGLVVIATANKIGVLGEALADRPNRFDVVLNFPCPDASTRKKFFIDLLEEIPTVKEKTVVGNGRFGHIILSEQELQELVEMTDNLSAIHCEEIVRRARIEAICCNEKANEEIENITAELIFQVARDVIDTHEMVVAQIAQECDASNANSANSAATVECSPAPPPMIAHR